MTSRNWDSIGAAYRSGHDELRGTIDPRPEAPGIALIPKGRMTARPTDCFRTPTDSIHLTGRLSCRAMLLKCFPRPQMVYCPSAAEPVPVLGGRLFLPRSRQGNIGKST